MINFYFQIIGFFSLFLKLLISYKKLYILHMYLCMTFPFTSLRVDFVFKRCEDKTPIFFHMFCEWGRGVQSFCLYMFWILQLGFSSLTSIFVTVYRHVHKSRLELPTGTCIVHCILMIISEKMDKNFLLWGMQQFLIDWTLWLFVFIFILGAHDHITQRMHI